MPGYNEDWLIRRYLFQALDGDGSTYIFRHNHWLPELEIILLYNRGISYTGYETLTSLNQSRYTPRRMANGLDETHVFRHLLLSFELLHVEYVNEGGPPLWPVELGSVIILLLMDEEGLTSPHVVRFGVVIVAVGVDDDVYVALFKAELCEPLGEAPVTTELEDTWVDKDVFSIVPDEDCVC